MNVIKQIVKDGQTIKMIVKDNERGPKGDDGAIHYTAGAGIYISPENVISTRGAGGLVLWGDIEGSLSDQTDLKNALDSKVGDLQGEGSIIIRDGNTIVVPYIHPFGFFGQVAETSESGNTETFWFDSFWENAPMKITLYGNGKRVGTPSPTNKVPIVPVGGWQEIKVSDGADNVQQFNIHLGSLELNAVSEFPLVNDYIDVDSEDDTEYDVYKRVGKVTLDGSNDESWAASGKTFYVTLSDKTKSEYGLCDYFDYVEEDFSTTDTAYRGKCTGNKDNTGIYFMPLQDQTLAEFKSWLSNHPITVCYVLDTPTATLITDSTLKSDLDTLKTARSYVVQTRFEITAKNTGYARCAIEAEGTRSTIGQVASEIEDLQDAVDSIVVPTVNNATLTIQQNSTNVATFTANSSTNVTANITTPVITMTSTDPGEGQPLAANNFIAVYEP